MAQKNHFFLLRLYQHVQERFAPPPREGDGEQVGGQAILPYK